MKKNKIPYNREILVVVILAVIYGFSVMVTGQACAMTFCQPQTPDGLYKICQKEDGEFAFGGSFVDSGRLHGAGTVV